jgi:DNA-binding LytR/AlgR family response regulator
MKVVIVDDEKPARRDLARILGKFEGFELAGEAKNGVEAIGLIERLAPDIILLDIHMPGLDGFEMLAGLEGSPMPAVIFVTAYDEYAVRAFEVHAVDYILKPVDEQRLLEALRHARDRIGGSVARPDIGAVLRSIGMVPQRVPLRHGGNLVLVDAADILYASVSGGEVVVVTGEIEGVSARRTLEEFHGDMPEGAFFRTHRSYLANIGKIHEIISWQNGGYRLRMGDGDGPLIPLSRQNAKELRKILGW